MSTYSTVTFGPEGNPSSLRPEQGTFTAWLSAIAHNVVSDYFRNWEKNKWSSIEAEGEIASTSQRLLQKFPAQMPDSTNYKPQSKMELSDDELDQAAGGVTGQQTNDTGCSLCSCRRPAATIERENCPICGHHRSGHK